MTTLMFSMSHAVVHENTSFAEEGLHYSMDHTQAHNSHQVGTLDGVSVLLIRIPSATKSNSNHYFLPGLFTSIKYCFLNSGTSVFIQDAPSEPAPSFLDHSLASAILFFSTTLASDNSSIGTLDSRICLLGLGSLESVLLSSEIDLSERDRRA